MLKSYIKRFDKNRLNTGGSTSYYPTQLATIYNFPTGYNGAGQTVGFIELGGGYIQSDLNSYCSGLGFTAPIVNFISVDGGTNSPTDDSSPDAEVMLDLCTTIGVANGIKANLYMAPNTSTSFINAVNQAIEDRVNIISISWGSPENEWGSYLTPMNNALLKAAKLGITVCVAAGDQGSGDGEGGTHVDFPGSSPYVLCCGGTTLTTSGNTWVSEVVWNDDYGTTGGGYSSIFASPTFQSGVTDNSKRGVPDVSAVADPNSGIKIICDGNIIVVGGTSGSAPLWAGLIARLNQKLNRNLGYINHLLYPLNTNLSLGFHDITSGDNGAYNASANWDACTGLGTPNSTLLSGYLRTHF